jgi:hypothetical protein
VRFVVALHECGPRAEDAAGARSRERRAPGQRGLGQARGTKRGAVRGAVDAPQRHVEHARQHVAPQVGARAAADHIGCSELRAGAGQRIARVAKGVRHALEHGLGHLRSRGSAVQAQERAAHRAVVVRRALAAQVGREPARRWRLGVSRQFAEQPRLVAARAGGPPRERGGGAQQHAHLVPGVRHGVAEGVHAALGRGCVAASGHPQHARGAEREEGVARVHRPQRHRAGRVVARPAGNDRRVIEAPAFDPGRTQFASRHGAFDQARHLRHV